MLRDGSAVLRTTGQSRVTSGGVTRRRECERLTRRAGDRPALLLSRRWLSLKKGVRGEQAMGTSWIIACKGQKLYLQAFFVFVF